MKYCYVTHPHAYKHTHETHQPIVLVSNGHCRRTDETGACRVHVSMSMCVCVFRVRAACVHDIKLCKLSRATLQMARCARAIYYTNARVVHFRTVRVHVYCVCGVCVTVAAAWNTTGAVRCGLVSSACTTLPLFYIVCLCVDAYCAVENADVAADDEYDGRGNTTNSSSSLRGIPSPNVVEN